MPNTTSESTSRPEIAPEVWAQIRSAVQSLKFGTVEVTVHDARIVQIERKEKLRFQGR